jgi:hypothetical protein
MISKNVSIGSLDIDPENGKIWLNCPNCLIRIQNIKFHLIEEKFSMIDISGEDAWMIPSNSSEDQYSNFIEQIISYIYPIVIKMTDEEKIKYLDKLSLIIKEDIDKCQC